MNNEVFEKSIILVGPPASGKSTLSARLSLETGFKEISVDYYRNRYRKNHNGQYTENDKLEIYREILGDLKEPAIISFGGGDGMFNDKQCESKFRNGISNFSNVILLMYSNDKEETINELVRRRTNEFNIQDDHVINDIAGDIKRIVNNNKFDEFCTDTVYTKNKNIDDITDEILNVCKEKVKNHQK